MSSPKESRAEAAGLFAGALDEIRAVLEAGADVEADRLCDELLRARRIATYGVGREGLMMRALCMRLMHLGLDAHVVGDMTTPHLGGADLFVVSAGPGTFSTVNALLGVARDAGARTVVVTAQPDGPAPRSADTVIHLRAQTMADDRAATAYCRWAAFTRRPCSSSSTLFASCCASVRARPWKVCAAGTPTSSED